MVGHPPEVRLLRDGQHVRQEVPVINPIELVRPRRPTGENQISGGVAPHVLRSPVTIEWVPIGHAASSEITVTRLGGRPLPGPPVTGPWEFEQTTADPTSTADLPPTAAGEVYMMRILARGERTPIAEGGFQFTVEEAARAPGLATAPGSTAATSRP